MTRALETGPVSFYSIALLPYGPRTGFGSIGQIFLGAAPVHGRVGNRKRHSTVHRERRGSGHSRAAVTFRLSWPNIEESQRPLGASASS